MLEAIFLPNTLSAWQNQADAAFFKQALTQELNQLDKTQLLLQSGLRQGNWVTEQPIQLMILERQANVQTLNIKLLIFYCSLNAGSCCENDPTPNSEIPETIEILLQINLKNARASIHLLTD